LWKEERMPNYSTQKATTAVYTTSNLSRN